MKHIIAVLSAFIILSLFLFCGCSRLALPLTGDETFSSHPEDETLCMRTLNELPDCFTAEYSYKGHVFTVIRKGNIVLKQNHIDEYSLYRQVENGWTCSYFENGTWNENVYTESDKTTSMRCLYFLTTASEAMTDGEKTGNTQTIAGISAEEHAYDNGKQTISCWFSPEIGITVKEQTADGTVNELLRFSTEASEFPIALP